METDWIVLSGDEGFDLDKGSLPKLTAAARGPGPVKISPTSEAPPSVGRNTPCYTESLSSKVVNCPVDISYESPTSCSNGSSLVGSSDLLANAGQGVGDDDEGGLPVPSVGRPLLKHLFNSLCGQKIAVSGDTGNYNVSLCYVRFIFTMMKVFREWKANETRLRNQNIEKTPTLATKQKEAGEDESKLNGVGRGRGRGRRRGHWGF